MGIPPEHTEPVPRRAGCAALRDVALSGRTSSGSGDEGRSKEPTGMCGICGVLDFEARTPDEGVIARMNSRLVHRGPDDGTVAPERRPRRSTAASRDGTCTRRSGQPGCEDPPHSSTGSAAAIPVACKYSKRAILNTIFLLVDIFKEPQGECQDK